MPESKTKMPVGIFFTDAIREALDEEMSRDQTVVLVGEDVGRYGGAFGVTRGLLDKFGEKRVLETPISENSVVGLAVGAAMMGLRPVVEIMFMDFITLAIDQIVNSAAKLHYMYDGQVNVPLVIRTPGGAKGGYGPSHSQMLSNLFTGVPGLKVVAPSGPAAAKGLLKSAIRDPNPVLFIENKRLYGRRGPVPEDNDRIMPLDRAQQIRTGTDVSLLTYSAMVPVCENLAKALEKRNVQADVVDLVTLNPLDRDAIAASVARTGRAIIVEEACVTGGVGAEIAAFLAEYCIDVLQAPVRRVGAENTPVPASPELEKHVLPNVEKIAAAVKAVLEW